MSDAPATQKQDNAVLKTSPEQVKAYEAMVLGGLEYRRMWDRQKRWKSYLAALSHNWTSGAAKDDSPVVNIVAARVRAQGPRLALNDPTFEVKSYGPPPTPNSEAANSAILAMTWKQEDFGTTLRKAILDEGTFGLGLGFVGYEKSDDGAILDQKRKLFGLVSPEFTNKVASVAPGIVNRLSSNEEVAMRFSLAERVFCERVSPFNFIIDPCASSFDDATYMARRLFLPAVRAKMMFGKNCPTADSVANVALYNDTSNSNATSQDGKLASTLPDSVKRVCVWELWDITSRATVYLDADGKAIKDGAFSWRSPHPGFPIVALLWDEIPDQVYPEGLMAAGWTLNAEINEIRKRQLAELRKAWSIFKGRNLTRETKRKLESGLKDGDILEVDEQEDLEALTMTSLPPEVWTVEDRAKNDLDQATGTTAYDSGGMPAVKRTATEASYSQGSSDALTSFRQIAVERWAAQVAERALAIITSCFDEVIPLRIENKDPDLIDPATGESVEIGVLIDFDYRGVDHAGYYSLNALQGSMAANAKDVEIQQLMGAFSLFSGMPGFDPVAMAKHIVAKFPSVHDPGQFFVDDTQPDAPEEVPPEMQIPAVPTDPMQQPPMMPPDQMAGLPLDGGSGNMSADLSAAMNGAMAPMTGDNGMGGAMNMGTPGF